MAPDLPRVLSGPHVLTHSGTSALAQKSDLAHSAKGSFPSNCLAQPAPTQNKTPGLTAAIVRRLSQGERQVPLEGLSAHFRAFAKVTIGSKKAPGFPGKQDYGGSSFVSWSISDSPKYLSTRRLELAAPLGIFSSLGAERT